ncbi:MAG: hypothetical protein R3233_02125 [Xanthomonadales bacterium]|nr:hypothetical protein [Xanthomonadales bacterium]
MPQPRPRPPFLPLVRFLLLACLLGPAPAALADRLDQILACNAAALGGMATLGGIDTLRFDLDIREPAFAVTGRYVASRDGTMRIDIFADGERVFAEGLEDGRAWQWTPAGLADVRPEGAAALRHGVEAPGRFWTLHQLRRRGLQVEWLEAGPQARSREWQLRLTRADGTQLDYFIDRFSCLPTREITRRALHPDVDPTVVTIETSWHEPFTVDGVVRFRVSEQRNLDSGEWLGTTRIVDVMQGLKLAEGFFAGTQPLHQAE